MNVTVLYVTNRAPHSILTDPKCSHYDLLSSCLWHQTHTDFDLVVVDGQNQLPRHELAWMEDRVTYCRPRVTPWTERGAFCAASARNAGLVWARGDVVLGMDDCTWFGDRLLEQVSTYAEQNLYLVPRYANEGRQPPKMPPNPLKRAGGILAYPRKVAIAAGGYEERMDACMALEDWEFSERLIRHGVTFVHDPECVVTLMNHLPHDAKQPRCCYEMRGLLGEQMVANRPWTFDQLTALSSPICTFADGTKCRISVGNICLHKTRPDAEALDIMHTYESRPWLIWPPEVRNA